MFKKKNKHNKLKGAAVVMSVAGAAAGLAAVALKDKKNQKIAKELATKTQKRGITIINQAKSKFKKMQAKKGFLKKVEVKKTVVKKPAKKIVAKKTLKK